MLAHSAIRQQCNVAENMFKQSKYGNRSKPSTLNRYRILSFLPERSQAKSISVSPVFDNMKCMHKLQVQLLPLIKCFLCFLSTTKTTKLLEDQSSKSQPDLLLSTVVTESHKCFREGDRNSTFIQYHLRIFDLRKYFKVSSICSVVKSIFTSGEMRGV